MVPHGWLAFHIENTLWYCNENGLVQFFKKGREIYRSRIGGGGSGNVCTLRYVPTPWDEMKFYLFQEWSETFPFSSFCDSDIRPSNNLLPKFSLWMINFCGREMAHGPVFFVPSSRCCSSCHNFRPFSQLVNFFHTCNLMIKSARCLSKLL